MYIGHSTIKYLAIAVGVLATTFCGVIAGETVAGETVKVHALAALPVLDGDGADWMEVPGTVITLHKSNPSATTNTRSALIKVGVYGEYVCFYIEWEDATQDDTHKPWVWDSSSQKYLASKRLEDQFALQFATGGDYTTDWFLGGEFTADMWHWKASRSNPLGLAHDKSTMVSRQKLLRAYKGVAIDGKPIYIARPADKGDKLYVTKRYRKYNQDLMPKYLLIESPQGSVADVEARGVWAGGKWHLELRRKLNTGDPVDIVFGTGDTILGGIAVFDRSENDDHVISNPLTFKF